MLPNDDTALLRAFINERSDAAFAAIVTRHVNLVYSVALRHVNDPHHADEITQAVFVILAKKARRLRHERALSSWLFQTTRLTAANLIRSESRRHKREQEAYMRSTLDASPEESLWPQMAPLLDAAVASLNESDRRAVVLRFYENRSFPEMASVLDASEDAAKKRVARALERLRRYFSRRGVNSTVAAIAGTMLANSIQAAPPPLTASVTAVALTHGATASASTITLIQGALKIMAWTKAKTAVAAVAAIILATGTTVVVTRSRSPNLSSPNFNIITWNAAEKYLADEMKAGRDHNEIVLIEDLRRAGYLDEPTFQWAKQQPVPFPEPHGVGLPQFKVPPDLGDKKIVWITVNGKTLTFLSDGTLN